jgi:hypothetical protein
MENTTAIASKAVGLTFNAAAVSAFMAKAANGKRFRLAVKDDTLFIRPTDRVKGPHVFADFPSVPAAGSTLKVQLTDEQIEKLGVTLEQGSKFGIKEDRYGWFFLTTDESAGIEGAKASVVKAA